MPALKNPKHEKIAQALAGGESQKNAYISAGYAVNAAACRASRIIKLNPQIQERAAELKERIANRLDITVGHLIAELDNAMSIAANADTPQATAMVNAVMGKAKILGLIVDKSKTEITGQIAILSADDERL